MTDVYSMSLLPASSSSPKWVRSQDLLATFPVSTRTSSHATPPSLPRNQKPPTIPSPTIRPSPTTSLSLEARILPALSFDTHVSLPHPLAITYLQTLDFLAQPKKHIAARTVHHLNTALLSPQLLYLTHQPNALATAAIYAAARDVGAKMPECAWWEVFDVDREQLGFLMVALRSLEGWMSKRREDMPWLSRGLITREAVNGELKRRGLHASNGQHFVDEEQAVMAMLDQR